MPPISLPLTARSRRRGALLRHGRAGLAVLAVSLLVGAGLVLPGDSAAAATRAGIGAGANTTSSQSVPSGSLFVAWYGNDAASGTQGAPLRSIGRAVQRAGWGQTIVVRAGTYNESVTIPSGKSVKIQNYPGEFVNLTGAAPVTNVTRSGNVWVAPNFTSTFDRSPTFSWGAADGTGSRQFLNPAHPLAAHPEQVWVGDTELRQVGSASAVVPGTFFADAANRRLVIGSDPAGGQVLASNLQRAFTILAGADDVSISGIYVSKYAPSVPHQGSITSWAARTTLRNVTVADSATAGIGIFGQGSRIDSCTIRGAGQVGIIGHYADGLVVHNTRITNSNDENFNFIPSAGGIKTTKTRGLTVSNSYLYGTNGNAIWTDESTTDITVVNNDIRDTANRAIFIELSSRARIVNNLVVNTRGEQITVRNSDNVRVWNNTVIGNRVAIEFTQDSRRPGNAAYAVDPRHRDVSFVSSNNQAVNNVVQASTQSNRIMNVEDFTKTFSGAQMVSWMDGNVYSRPGSAPGWLLVWSRAGTDPFVGRTMAEVRAQSGQEWNSLLYTAGSAVDGQGRLVPGVSQQAAQVARPLPSDLASAAQLPAGSRVLGVHGR